MKSLKKNNNLLCIESSKFLLIKCRMDIGLKFSILYLSPDLNRGITRAIFRNNGNTLLEKDKFINLETTPPMILEISFNCK